MTSKTKLSLLAALVAALTWPAGARAAFPQFPAASGGGGAVSSVSAGSGCVTVSPTTGAVVVTSSGCLANSGGAVALSNLAAQADQTFVGNVSGGSASPIALTMTQARTALSVQASNAVNLTGGTIAGPTISLAPAQLSDGVVNVTGSTGVLNTPTLTGLSMTATTLKNTLITGLAGGQTITGGVATLENLTLAPTSADNTGKIIFGNVGNVVFNGFAGGPHLGIGTASPNFSGFATTWSGVSLASTSTGGTFIEGKRTTASTSLDLLDTIVYNGATDVAEIDIAGDGATDSGKISFLTRPTGGAATTRVTIASNGTTTFASPIALSNTLATPGSGVIVTTDAPTAVVSLSLKYINVQLNGVSTYILALQ